MRNPDLMQGGTLQPPLTVAIMKCLLEIQGDRKPQDFPGSVRLEFQRPAHGGNRKLTCGNEEALLLW